MRIERVRLVASIAGMIGLAVGGATLGNSIGSPPSAAATITQAGRIHVVTHTRVLKKVVRGRVVRLKGGTRVIVVSRVVIHNLKCHPTPRHKCVRRVIVPAHSIPLLAAVRRSVATAAVMVPVTVYVTVAGPTTTITLPPVTETLPQDTTTVTVPTTITVTLSGTSQ